MGCVLNVCLDGYFLPVPQRVSVVCLGPPIRDRRLLIFLIS